MQLEKISFFIWCTYGTYIHKLNKIWVFFLKKGGTSQAQGSQHWATIGANNSVHEQMEVWNEVLTDFWCNVKFSCWPTGKCRENLTFNQQSLKNVFPHTRFSLPLPVHKIYIKKVLKGQVVPTQLCPQICFKLNDNHT